MIKKLTLGFFLLLSLQVFAQKQSPKVIWITLDGLRWQELFTGADSSLVGDSGYTEHPDDLAKKFWKNDLLQRREILMPFVWSTMVNHGQIYGNREFDNKVDCSNQMRFSYPGYNEILTGFADDENIRSNDKVLNPNGTLLEYVNKQNGFENKVFAYGSWDVFPFIINEERSGVPVNAGFEKANGSLTERERFLNELQDEVIGPWGNVRLDVFTHHYAMECLKSKKPKLMYVAYGETDDYAHDGKYDHYLKSARQTDDYIAKLWAYVQSDPFYKNQTTLIITTDHGRGTVPKDAWRYHGEGTPESSQIWLMAIGPNVPALGEVKTSAQLYQNQVAATVAEALGVSYNQSKAGESIPSVFNK